MNIIEFWFWFRLVLYAYNNKSLRNVISIFVYIYRVDNVNFAIPLEKCKLMIMQNFILEFNLGFLKHWSTYIIEFI